MGECSLRHGVSTPNRALSSQAPSSLRAMVLIVAALLIAFPLGLCRSIDSLSGVSLCSLLFYALLTLHLLYLSLSHFSWGWWNTVGWWNNAGLLKCIPIFALAFACQTYVAPSGGEVERDL